ncbi:MAG: hypothetical protein KF819_00810 [Labilithrix sp.]|nr:hypothetical protein [Labilithrix sp.]
MRRTGTSTAALRLALWLGPWAGDRTPSGVSRREVVLAGGIRAYVHRPARARGVYLVAPGLHYLGPDDPRLDRFCRVLARAGFVVVAPFLPDFLALRIAPETARDLGAAFDHACAIADRERLPGPAVFSISFGSRPAIELCASPAGRRASALVLFGGFCDFDATVRFAITGRAEDRGERIEVPHDPLNAPVVHLNLLPFHARARALDREALARALREMVVSTWGRPELKIGEARARHADRIAEGLGPRERAFFYGACGLSRGLKGEELLEEGLASCGDAFAWADPRPHLARFSREGPEVVIVHGRDDDVIPWLEASKLAAALPDAHRREVILTGLYGHTGASMPGPRAAIAEACALVNVVQRLARAPRARSDEERTLRSRGA